MQKVFCRCMQKIQTYMNEKKIQKVESYDYLPQYDDVENLGDRF